MEPKPLVIVEENDVIVFNPIYDINDVIRWANS